MIYQADKRKSRTQWAKELKGTECKTFTHPTGCKHGHDKLFSVSEGGKCVECVRLKDRKRNAKRLGMTLEEYAKQQADKQLERDKTKASRIAARVANREAKRLTKKAKREANELKKAEDAERKWWAAQSWRLEQDEAKAQPEYAHIYAITNTVNKKTYIGSSTAIKTRLANHRSGIKHGTHHVADIVTDAEKHGPDSFHIEILSTLLPDSKEERLAVERHYIETWNGELYNKHYHTDNYGGSTELRAEYMCNAVANLK